MADILTANALSVGYRSGKAVVSGLEFSIRPGEIVTLIGANGAGKSTILKSIARQLEPLNGTVYLGGIPESGMKERDIAQKLSLFLTGQIRTELMTCYDVAATGRYPYTGRLGILNGNDREKIAEAMRLTHTETLADSPFTEISDGQRQRVLLARAICQEPELLVLDEPTSYLDIRHKLELLTLVRMLAKERNTAILMSLHELDLAERVSNRLICIRDGKADRIGTPAEIFRGSYIRELYGIERGSFDPLYGTPELDAPAGEPAVFVIGGNGTGIPVYRRLQREGIPFAAGVLHENDLDLPCARALAAEVITERAFEPVSEEAVRRALSVMEQCREVICTVGTFGTMNRGNQRLLDAAAHDGKLKK
jgi:iron complex transport system ATP-binding protein